MATLLLSTVGTALGGPLGGALGALAGRSLDSAIAGGSSRDGPRLRELSVTTSSYGTGIPRHFGSVRTSGTVIWATELQETKETAGGGKGQPKVSSFSYSVSFAVAVASTPILGIGRIWADGNLMRGAAGDLKTEGRMRIYTGGEDQTVDPLIAADVGIKSCPAHRGLSYVVFEDLALADFGNRIPTLSFEIFATQNPIGLGVLLGEDLVDGAEPKLTGMLGFSHESGTYAEMLSSITNAWPIACDGAGGKLNVRHVSASAADDIVELPNAVVGEIDDFGTITGFASERSNDEPVRQVGLRYYDVDRDYQPGIQRGRARSGNGEIATVELPAALRPNDARRLADEIAMRRLGGRESMTYRVAELDGRIFPGAIVSVPQRAGKWRVENWEWRHTGVELTLSAIPAPLASGMRGQGSGGQTLPPSDLPNGVTRLSAFGLPWDGTGDSSTISLFAAASSPAAGWKGAALFADFGGGSLRRVGSTGRTQATMGVVEGRLPAASPLVLDRANSIVVALTSPDMTLSSASLQDLSLGANRARIGEEIVQFGLASPIGEGRWRLSQLLRGRGGTESGVGRHVDGELFVLIDNSLVLLDPALAGPPPVEFITALGSGDSEPVVTSIIDPNASLRPYSPVHGSIAIKGDGTHTIGWTRRSRGSFAWLDAVELPLNEPAEAYEIRFVSNGVTQASWRSAEPHLDLAEELKPQTISDGHFEVRQIGASGLSQPLRIYPEFHLKTEG